MGPEVLKANGVEDDVAVFRLDRQTFAAFLERETFREARISNGRVHVLLGNVWLEFDRGLPPGVRRGGAPE